MKSVRFASFVSTASALLRSGEVAGGDTLTMCRAHAQPLSRRLRGVLTKLATASTCSPSPPTHTNTHARVYRTRARPIATNRGGLYTKTPDGMYHLFPTECMSDIPGVAWDIHTESHHWTSTMTLT